MNMRHRVAVIGCLALALGLRAEAATVSLQPSATLVAQNGAFTVELLLNASDAPGTHPGRYSGEVVLDFDPALLTYGGFTLASGISFLSGAPVVGTANGHQTVTFGFENAGDVGSIGTFAFTAIGSPGSIATLGIADADSFFGSFISELPTNQPFYPVFTGTSVQVIPLPGAAWLMLTAFGIVGLRIRRQAPARSAGR